MRANVNQLPELAYQKGRAVADREIRDSGISDRYPNTRDVKLLELVDQGEDYRDRAVMGGSGLYEHFGRGIADRAREAYGNGLD